MTRCPCGTGLPYADCCGPLHAGSPAPTAEALMRSRYSAFARGDVDHLLATWHPATRSPRLALDPQRRWTRLEVTARRGGGLLDAEGEVEFRAHSRQAGRDEVLAERSRFTRHDGRWVYVDGTVGPVRPGGPSR